jgi:hypothetical protein
VSMPEPFEAERALAIAEYEEATISGDRQRQIAALARIDQLAMCAEALRKYWRKRPAPTP